MRANLFQQGKFTLHSGQKSSWIVDCEALTDTDWETIAAMIAKKISFRTVIGVPEGGLKLAHKLEKYEKYHNKNLPTLIVDDVLTTGSSMEELKSYVEKHRSCVELTCYGEQTDIKTSVIGVVLFSRGTCPDWIIPMWQLEKLW